MFLIICCAAKPVLYRRMDCVVCEHWAAVLGVGRSAWLIHGAIDPRLISGSRHGTRHGQLALIRHVRSKTRFSCSHLPSLSRRRCAVWGPLLHHVGIARPLSTAWVENVGGDTTASLTAWALYWGLSCHITCILTGLLISCHHVHESRYTLFTTTATKNAGNTQINLAVPCDLLIPSENWLCRTSRDADARLPTSWPLLAPASGLGMHRTP